MNIQPNIYILSSAFDFEDDLLELELEFPLIKDKYMYIKINKFCDIGEIRYFLRDYGYTDVKIYYNQKELKSGSFLENNIITRTSITIHPIFSTGIFNTTQSITNRDIITLEIDKSILNNIISELDEFREEIREENINLNLNDIEKINNKYNMFMEEEIQRKRDLLTEKESMKNKLIRIKKMRELAKNNKLNKEELIKKTQEIIKQEQLEEHLKEQMKEKNKEKNNFGGFKKGFLLKSRNN